MAKVLQRAYDRFNKKYFDGVLPKIPVQWSEVLKPMGRKGDMRAYAIFTPMTDGSGIISISSEIKSLDEVWKMTLIHEMAHVKLREHPEEVHSQAKVRHSKVWHKEMRRLAEAGAFDDLW